MQNASPNHYSTLGLDRCCTTAQIRAAYRLLVKRHHPDRNPASSEALLRSQELNAAHAVLSDPARRRSYDREIDRTEEETRPSRAGKPRLDVARDVQLRIEDFFLGTSLEVRVADPGNPSGPETYHFQVPPDTVPGARFRIPRQGEFEGGFVNLRVRPSPNFRFKVRGSDLRCDLRISSERATQGGVEGLSGPTGHQVRVTIPPRVQRGETIRIAGEGLPKPRGGRGDILVRITYRLEVRVTRSR